MTTDRPAVDPTRDDADLTLLLRAAEEADVGLLVLDSALTPVVCSLALRRLHGHEERPFVRGEFPGTATLRQPDGRRLPTGAGIVERVLAHGKVDALPIAVLNERTGRLRPVLVHGRRLDGPEGLLGVVLTVVACDDDRLEIEAGLRRQAEHDELTGLLNRRGFMRRGDELLSLLRAQGGTPVLCAFDVDGLKAVNDSHGHAAGDDLLRLVARAAEFVADEHRGVAARVGGDEFVIVLERDAPAEDSLTYHLERLRAGARLPFQVHVSIGCAEAIGPADDLLRLLSRADGAMYDRRRRRRPSRGHV